MVDTGLQTAPARAMPRRWVARVVALSLMAAVIVLLTLALPYDSPEAALILDRQRHTVFPYPLTIQNAIYMAMAWAMADLYSRWRAARREASFLRAGLLPEDTSTVLALEDLGPIRQRVAGLHDRESGYLPYLIDLSVLQLQASRSVDQAMSMLNGNLSLLQERLDLKYQMIRYLLWLIPTTGFIGTVIGLSLALELINPVSIDLGLVVDGLAISFYTTLVALVASAILAFVQHAVQEMEESALNEAGLYCLRNLVNRVYIPRAGG